MKKKMAALIAGFLMMFGLVATASVAPASAANGVGLCDYSVYPNTVSTTHIYFGATEWGNLYVRTNSFHNNYCAETITTIPSLTGVNHYTYAMINNDYDGTTVSYYATYTNVAVHANYSTAGAISCFYARGRIDDLNGHTAVYNSPSFC